MLQILTVFLMALNCSHVLATTIEDRTFSAKDVSKILVKNQQGAVDVVAVSGDTIRVKINKTKWADGCHFDSKIMGRGLNLISKSTGGFFGPNCGADIKVEVPKTIRTKIKTGSGNISVLGLQDKVEFATGSGDVKIEGTGPAAIKGETGSGSIYAKSSSGKVEFETGSGDIEITDLASETEEVEAEVGSGDIRISYREKPVRGKVEASSGSGDITVSVPKATKVRTNLKTGSGEVKQYVAHDDNAPFRVSMRAGSGNVTLKSF